MPWYFLHIRNGGEFIEDNVGSEYVHLAAALDAAVEGARDILAEMVRLGEPLNGQQIEVCDQAGKLVGTVRFRDTFDVQRSDKSADMTPTKSPAADVSGRAQLSNESS